MAASTNFVMNYFSFVSQIMSTLIIVTCIVFIPIFTVTAYIMRYWIQQKALKQPRSNSSDISVAFFHPYCNAGGGGERVLWVAIRSLQNKYPNVKCVVFTGDTDATADDILLKAQQRFNITLPRNVSFIFLRSRRWVEAKKYPVFTLLGQSLGSVVLAWEALTSFVPDIYIDSMGYAFTVPVFKFFGNCKVSCYIHYPTISTDMLENVSDRKVSYNNAGFISRSPVLSKFKLVYYKLFAYLYGAVGNRSDIIMVNSSWTYNHIRKLWQVPEKTMIVYPPCDISEFLKLPLNNSNCDKRNIVSIGQFRPEKDHPLQIKAFHKFLMSQPNKSTYKLIIAGGCRNTEDTRRVEALKELCEELKISEYVTFKLNVSFEELKNLMSSSEIGLHTMWNEHFGIGIVELMAAGTVILAHNSGGPKMDIVTPYDGNVTGFLADDIETYAENMDRIFNLSVEDKVMLQNRARQSVLRFSEDEFTDRFLSATKRLFLS